MKILRLFLCLCLIGYCGSAIAQSAKQQSGAKKKPQRLYVTSSLLPGAIKVGKLVRHFYVLIPKSIRKRKPIKAPVILYLHGGGPDTEALGTWRRSRMGKIADREGFIVVYPNGLGNQWNDARIAEFEKVLPAQFADDVAFLRALIDGLVNTKIADPKRIYMTGASNGGMMTFTAACRLADRLAAVAPAIASMPVELRDTCKPARPLPLLMMNGTKDRIISWQGGRVSPMRKHDLGYILSVDHSLRIWRRLNGCSDRAKLWKLKHKNAKDPTKVEIIRWQDCKAGAEVVLYKIVGGGHNWPGTDMKRKPKRLRPYLGHSNQDFDPREALWKFFKRHGLSG